MEILKRIKHSFVIQRSRKNKLKSAKACHPFQFPKINHYMIFLYKQTIGIYHTLMGFHMS